MTTVREVMTANPIAMDVNTTLDAIARQMRDEAIGDVIVTEGDKVCGIVTDRDIAVRAVAADADPRATTVGQVLTRDPVTVAPDDDIRAAEGLMRTHAVKRLPVLERDRLVGVVALGDIEVEESPDSLEAAIAAEDPNN
ncbi:CBS domain-containing protein [Planosporangium sp. 12N6]|uniref:CBS domain-containing protein n=1 Tax=Planosporangium spinosum TaxID=3402278 RepID=UPI003CEC4284